MAIPRTREEAKQYCFRRLGHPVINIDVDDRQVEDRIDDAIAMFQEYHYDGTVPVILKHKITATTLTFSAPPSTAFQRGETIIGSVSNARGIVYDAPTANTLRIRTVSGNFQPNENVVGSATGGVATIPVGASNVVIGDIDRRGFLLEDTMMSVTNVYLGNELLGGSSDVLSLKYQSLVGTISDIGRLDLVDYNIVRNHLALVDNMINGLTRFRFSRMTNAIQLDIDWSDIRPDQYIVIEGVQVLDMANNPESWWSIWFVNYLTALIKQQWGANLKSKFQGMQLPGGATVDGQTLYNEASSEIQRLEQQAAKEFQEPPRFFLG